MNKNDVLKPLKRLLKSSNSNKCPNDHPANLSWYLLVIVTVNGNLSSSNCNYTSVYTISGTIITIDIDISCGGIGLPIITPYTEVVNLGSIPSNSYSLVVNQYSFGSLQEMGNPIKRFLKIN